MLKTNEISYYLTKKISDQISNFYFVLKSENNVGTKFLRLVCMFTGNTKDPFQKVALHPHSCIYL